MHGKNQQSTRPNKTHRPAKHHKPLRTEQRNLGESSAKGEWIIVEEHDESGRPIVPRKLLADTISTRYESTKHTDMRLLLNTGYAPHGALIGQYKIYDVHAFDMDGWRRRAEVVLELGPYRYYEEKWFDVYQGSEVVLSDPGLPGSISKEYEMVVEESTFRKKLSSRSSGRGQTEEVRVYEAHLRMTETLRSTVRRHGSQVLKYLVVTIVTAIVAAIVGMIL